VIAFCPLQRERQYPLQYSSWRSIIKFERISAYKKDLLERMPHVLAEPAERRLRRLARLMMKPPLVDYSRRATLQEG